ncbi:MAG: hypothetical protein DRQ55_05805 [Planctomycetota bacterium]|nr:MAG: hypothetical protein DRQ55_05805 [Planctomycetota bacterium]
MRGLVMLLMVVDHVSMAFNAQHVAADSAAFTGPGTVLDPLNFASRWITHLCAPTFVFLAGTALAISVERRVAKGEAAGSVDMGMLKRGAFIALLDPTLVSLCSGRMTFQVLYAIGGAMMCMALLRRLPSAALLLLGLGWIVGGEWVTRLIWDPASGSSSPALALLVGVYGGPGLAIKYALIPWLAMMVLGWVFGRWLLKQREGVARVDPVTLLSLWGLLGVAVFVAVRALDGYGNMALLRDGDSWVQWLHVSKYPPSLGFASVQLGLMALLLAALIVLERRVGVGKNGVLLVFGQTAMFFYLVHRVVLETAATWLGLRGVTGLGQTWLISALLLVLLYPLCLWWRGLKARHKGQAWTTYL